MAGTLILILGPTGAGKSVQAQTLATERGWVRISTGELLRQSQDPQLQGIIRSGQLAPSSSVQRLLQDAVERVSADDTIVMDGFPRLINEAQWLDELLQRLGRPLARVLTLEIDPAESHKRLAVRGRADDTPPALERKWDKYRHDTQPVLDLYRRRGKLTQLDGHGSVEQVAARIAQVFD